MLTVKDVLNNKSREPLAIKSPQATVREALELMAERDIGAVLVMRGDLLEGIFTERDYARKINLQELNSVNVTLGDVMTPRLYVVHPEQTVQECMGIMSQAHIRHLPVVENGKIINLVSIGDLVKVLLREQNYLIDQLEAYIAG